MRRGKPNPSLFVTSLVQENPCKADQGKEDQAGWGVFAILLFFKEHSTFLTLKQGLAIFGNENCSIFGESR